MIDCHLLLIFLQGNSCHPQLHNHTHMRKANRELKILNVETVCYHFVAEPIYHIQ